ncbi:MAG: flagellar hook-associated protein FlgL [Planctomycetota bacterium]
MLRVTQNLYHQSTQQSLGQSLERLYRTQQQVASGRRIEKPSDDARSIGRLLSVKRNILDVAQFQKNVNEGRSFTDSASATVLQMSELAQSARETIIQALTPTNEDNDRIALADEIDGYLRDLVGLGNARVAGRYVFAGTATDRQPFDFEFDATGRERVVYGGNGDTLQAEIGPGLFSPLNLPGSELFGGGRRGETVYGGLTGAKPAATGTDSGEGLGRLTVSHVSTVYFGGGILPGASSVGGDTILGIGHQIEVSRDDNGAQQVALNGGKPVHFDGSETDLEVRGPDGERVYLDLTGVASSFTGTVAGNAEGTLSLDGGASSTPIDFNAASQRIFDSVEGRVLNVDPRGIRRAGEESLIHRGTTDIFSVLVGIRDELRRAGQERSISEDLDFVRELLADFDDAHDKVLAGAGRLGTFGSRLEAVSSRLLDDDFNLESQRSNLEDVDFAEAASRLERDQASYQAALLVTSRIGQLSLLNYLG